MEQRQLLQKKQRVIIDTDPGIDDSLALIVALTSSDKIQVDAITIGIGNNKSLMTMARNACFILEMTEEKKIPVYLGSIFPLVDKEKWKSAEIVHGEDGLGNVTLTEKYEEAFRYLDLTSIQKNISASEFIVAHCKQFPGEISILALAPVTNVALALKLNHDLSSYLKQIVAMCGSFNHPGNISPVAEANAFNDPDALHVVLNSGIQKLTLIPLNLTHNLLMTNQFMENLRKCGKYEDFLYDIHQFYINFCGEMTPIHDATVLIYFLHPDWFKSIETFVAVETSKGLCQGQTIADWKGQWKKEPNCSIAMELVIDTDKFRSEILKRLKCFNIEE